MLDAWAFFECISASKAGVACLCADVGGTSQHCSSRRLWPSLFVTISWSRSLSLSLFHSRSRSRSLALSLSLSLALPRMLALVFPSYFKFQRGFGVSSSADTHPELVELRASSSAALRMKPSPWEEHAAQLKALLIHSINRGVKVDRKWS